MLPDATGLVLLVLLVPGTCLLHFLQSLLPPSHLTPPPAPNGPPRIAHLREGEAVRYNVVGEYEPSGRFDVRRRRRPESEFVGGEGILLTLVFIHPSINYSLIHVLIHQFIPFMPFMALHSS